MAQTVARGAGKPFPLLIALGLVLTSAACSGPAAPTAARTLAPLPTVGPSTAPPTPTPATPAPTPALTETPAATETEAATLPAETPSALSSAGASAGRPGANGASASPSETPIDLAPYLTASVAVVNVAAVEVAMDIGIVGDDGTVTSVMKVQLEPFDFLSQQVVPANYKITWTYAGSGAKPATCQLKIADGEQFSFTVSDHLVAVTKDGVEPTSGAELVVSTSSLCAP